MTEVPCLVDSFEPRTETRAYRADVTRFGAPHAPPDLADAPDLGRHHEDDLIANAIAGTIDRPGLTALCRMYRQLQRELLAERDAHQATTLELEAEQIENDALRHQLDDRTMTPAAPPEIDLDLEVDLGALIVETELFDDTVKMRLPGPPG